MTLNPALRKKVAEAQAKYPAASVVDKEAFAAYEKELFAAYLRTKVPEYDTSVRDFYLTGFECFSLDKAMSDMVNGILNGDPEPLPEIDFMIQELTGMAANLKHLKDGFVAFKSKRIV